jgi:predicted dehydrogenase
MSRIRLGIIGCGDMQSAHQQIFQELADKVVVTATADIDIEKARSAAHILGAEHAVSHYEDLFPYVDAVLVVTPHDLHHEMGMKSFDAGKHVLMEKPMAVSEEECTTLINASEKSGKVLMVAYPMRYQPLVVKLKELIDQEYLGKVFHVGIFTEQLTQPPEGHWIRSAKQLGGGQFFSHGCHYIDLLLWFLGRPSTGIHIGTRLGTPWMEREGTSDAVITFESGAIGHHFGTWGARATRHGYSIHVHCDRGMLEADITNGVLYAHHGFEGDPPRGGIAGTLSPDPRAAEVVMQIASESKYLQGELAHFLWCIENGEMPLTDGSGSLQGLRVIWRLEEAEKQGKFADLVGLGLDQA